MKKLLLLLTVCGLNGAQVHASRIANRRPASSGITFVGSPAVTPHGATQSPAVNYPSGIQANDILIAAVKPIVRTS